VHDQFHALLLSTLQSAIMNLQDLKHRVTSTRYFAWMAANDNTLWYSCTDTSVIRIIGSIIRTIGYNQYRYE